MRPPSEGGQQQQQVQHAGPAAVQGIKSPMWLTPERFDDLDFSPDVCVADLRRYVPLPTVKAELQAYLLQLKNKLVEAINEDYSDYVGLSSRLGGLEGAVVRMRQPLLDIQGKLTAVQDAIKAELQALQQGLQRRQDAAAARATLELMQEVAASTGKVEKLLEEVAAAAAAAAAGLAQQQEQQQRQSTDGQQAAASGSSVGAPGSGGAAAAPAAAAVGGEELDAHCRLLERVSGEAARLLYLVERGKLQHLAFVKALERRVMSCRMNLDRQLQAALTRALAARAWPAATHCLRGYLELGEPGRGEEGLRSGLVAPLLKHVVSDVRQQQLASGGSGGSSAGGALAAVVQASLAQLQEAAGPLLSALSAPGSGLGGFDLLGAVLLAEISQAVADGMPGVFSPGNPSSFQANYVAGQALLQQLEAVAGSRAAVERLRASSAAAGWAKRWNLPVYFSLVFQDVAGTFEAAAKASQLQHAAPNQQQQQPQLRLAVSAALWTALQRCVAPDVFLQQLADRFAKLAFQLLVRYDTWLQDIASTRQAALAAAAAGAPPAAGIGTAVAAAGGLGAGPAAPGSPVAAAAGAGVGAAAAAAAAVGPAGWAGSMAADECAVICADADAVQRLVVGSFCPQLAALLAGLPADTEEQLTGTLKQLADNIAQHGQQVLLLVGGDVLERCMAMVRQLKGITATYRMTAKGPPVRHSHYVAGVLQPLRQLLETAGPVQQLPEALKLLLARDVISNVNVRYNALAEELLTTVKKTESSLKRLKKTRPGEEAAAAAGAAAMSDSDKICLQLYLDVQEHGRQIAKFGLAAEQLDSFSQLLATVTPPEQQQQQPAGGAEQQ